MAPLKLGPVIGTLGRERTPVEFEWEGWSSTVTLPEGYWVLVAQVEWPAGSRSVLFNGKTAGRAGGANAASAVAVRHMQGDVEITLGSGAGPASITSVVAFPDVPPPA